MSYKIKHNRARLKALANGSVHYQGPPCPHGHSAVRLTSTGSCVECRRVLDARNHLATRGPPVRVSPAPRIDVGVPTCVHSHLEGRWVKGGCVVCVRERVWRRKARLKAELGRRQIPDQHRDRDQGQYDIDTDKPG
jgi:hypothetical protein